MHPDVFLGLSDLPKISKLQQHLVCIGNLIKQLVIGRIWMLFFGLSDLSKTNKLQHYWVTWEFD